MAFFFLFESTDEIEVSANGHHILPLPFNSVIYSIHSYNGRASRQCFVNNCLHGVMVQSCFFVWMPWWNDYTTDYIRSTISSYWLRPGGRVFSTSYSSRCVTWPRHLCVLFLCWTVTSCESALSSSSWRVSTLDKCTLITVNRFVWLMLQKMNVLSMQMIPKKPDTENTDGWVDRMTD